MKKIVLASKSPRRKQILEAVGLKFEILVSDFDEKTIPQDNPKEFVERVSQEKAKVISNHVKDAVIIAADTIVVLEGEIIGKPKSGEDAVNMLKKLSGRDHLVITGFTIMDSSAKVLVTRSVESIVYFKEILEEEIQTYVATQEPMDKAGGYGIQDKGGIFLDRVEGDYLNVVGLPLRAVYEELKNFGVDITKSW